MRTLLIMIYRNLVGIDRIFQELIEKILLNKIL